MYINTYEYIWKISIGILMMLTCIRYFMKWAWVWKKMGSFYTSKTFRWIVVYVSISCNNCGVFIICMGHMFLSFALSLLSQKYNTVHHCTLQWSLNLCLSGQILRVAPTQAVGHELSRSLNRQIQAVRLSLFFMHLKNDLYVPAILYLLNKFCPSPYSSEFLQ